MPPPAKVDRMDATMKESILEDLRNAKFLIQAEKPGLAVEMIDLAIRRWRAATTADLIHGST